MKEWHFYEPIYRRWVVLMIGEPQVFRNRLEELGYKHMDFINPETASGMGIRLTADNNSMGSNCFIIWLSKWSLGCLVHEISHLCIDVFDSIGVPVSVDNTEGLAFYTEYWYMQITRIHRSYPNGRRPQDVKK